MSYIENKPIYERNKKEIFKALFSKDLPNNSRLIVVIGIKYFNIYEYDVDFLKRNLSIKQSDMLFDFVIAYRFID